MTAPSAIQTQYEWDFEEDEEVYEIGYGDVGYGDVMDLFADLFPEDH